MILMGQIVLLETVTLFISPQFPISSVTYSFMCSQVFLSLAGDICKDVIRFSADEKITATLF